MVGKVLEISDTVSYEINTILNSDCRIYFTDHDDKEAAQTYGFLKKQLAPKVKLLDRPIDYLKV